MSLNDFEVVKRLGR